MSISDAERAELGERIRIQRERRFGTKSAAYTEAGVNAATWDKAEAGKRLRPDRLQRVVRALWPESEGDWTAIDGPGSAADSERVREMEARIEALEGLFREIEGRLPPEEDESSRESGTSA